MDVVSVLTDGVSTLSTQRRQQSLTAPPFFLWFFPCEALLQHKLVPLWELVGRLAGVGLYVFDRVHDARHAETRPTTCLMAQPWAKRYIKGSETILFSFFLL